MTDLVVLLNQNREVVKQYTTEIAGREFRTAGREFRTRKPSEVTKSECDVVFSECRWKTIGKPMENHHLGVTSAVAKSEPRSLIQNPRLILGRKIRTQLRAT